MSQNNFNIGSQVIAIIDHSDGIYKQGDVFTLLGMKVGCKCAPLLLDIGLGGRGTECNDCKKDFGNDVPWFISSSFAPYINEKSVHTIESLMKEIERELVIR